MYNVMILLFYINMKPILDSKCSKESSGCTMMFIFLFFFGYQFD